jgi:hypothetical protein
MEQEFKRKDLLVHKLADELKKTTCVSVMQTSSPERTQVAWSIPGVYVAGVQQQKNARTSQNNIEFRKQIKELKAELVLKENELLNT